MRVLPGIGSRGRRVCPCPVQANRVRGPDSQGRVATQLLRWEEEAEAPAGLQSTGSATPGTRASAGFSRDADSSTSVHDVGGTIGPLSAHPTHRPRRGRGNRWHGVAVDGMSGKQPRPWTIGQSPIVFYCVAGRRRAGLN